MVFSRASHRIQLRTIKIRGTVIIIKCLQYLIFKLTPSTLRSINWPLCFTIIHLNFKSTSYSPPCLLLACQSFPPALPYCSLPNFAQIMSNAYIIIWAWVAQSVQWPVLETHSASKKNHPKPEDYLPLSVLSSKINGALRRRRLLLPLPPPSASPPPLPRRRCCCGCKIPLDFVVVSSHTPTKCNIQ
jgi:hypothetical protein